MKLYAYLTSAVGNPGLEMLLYDQAVLTEPYHFFYCNACAGADSAFSRAVNIPASLAWHTNLGKTLHHIRNRVHTGEHKRNISFLIYWLGGGLVTNWNISHLTLELYGREELRPHSDVFIPWKRVSPYSQL
jgi:hypothetical protein